MAKPPGAGPGGTPGKPSVRRAGSSDPVAGLVVGLPVAAWDRYLER